MSQRYRTIVADPPWPITRRMGAGGRTRSGRMKTRSRKQAAFERALAALRPDILKRDGYQCRACGVGPVWCGLEVHHVSKRGAAKTLRLAPENLVTLCGPNYHHNTAGCHEKTDWPYAKGKLRVTAEGGGKFTFKTIVARDKFAARGADELGSD